MPAATAIFGLGNPLMSDEGVGLRVLELLARSEDLPEDVELIDLGSGGVRLLHLLEGRRKAIFVDCAFMGQEPGTLRRFRLDEVRSTKLRLRRSLHEGDLLETLALAAELGTLPEDVVIFGIEPKSVGPGTELSPGLEARSGEYAKRVREEASFSEA